MLAMVQARVKKKDPVAICHLGGKYVHGMLGLQKDAQKAVELWTEAAEALYNLGVVYALGEGVGQDRAKGIQMYEKAAMGGNIGSRHNLGCNELEIRIYLHMSIKDTCINFITFVVPFKLYVSFKQRLVIFNSV